MESKPRTGDVIYVDRGLYKHYGVYVGGGQVVHFAAKDGSEINADNAIIHKCTLSAFLKDGKLLVDTLIKHKYPFKETAQRALSCVGERGHLDNGYNLVFNNCEHFASWCASGEERSRQVESAVQGAAVVAATAVVIGAGLSIAKTLIKDGGNKNRGDA